ncbi:hypothetical protein [Streptomyces sp. N1]|uniref:hypothetical protein n=1 Tax=Streptomyces sp. N1 TaxID=576456 RepID=UPI001011CAB5|nr:hypothetical protein [Streptomyces sp. N1]
MERHIIEVDTGLLPNMAEDATPREGYAPEQFTLIERYKAKALELNAVLDWDVSWHTVQRKRLLYREKGIWGLVDKRRTRTPSLFRTDRFASGRRPVGAGGGPGRKGGDHGVGAVRAVAALSARQLRQEGGRAAEHDAVQAAGPVGISVRDLRAPTRRRLEAPGGPLPRSQ